MGSREGHTPAPIGAQSTSKHRQDGLAATLAWRQGQISNANTRNLGLHWPGRGLVAQDEAVTGKFLQFRNG